MGSRVIPQTIDNTGTHSPRRPNQPSTAHITSDGRLSTALLNNRNAKFAYDELVLACAAFLGSPIINDTVTHFAENILTILEPPTALDSAEVKRRIEQVLPVARECKHHRGMSLSDKDCTRLCSLADRVINNAPYTNLNIVDEEEADKFELSSNNLRRTSGGGSGGDVQYINNHKPVQLQQLLPKQLPSFVEPNFEIEGGDGEYDLDVTPYDSEVDEPIRIEE
ncbi:hypothetical protein HPULCUR_004883 [Helicostylum pulchrum]|uniref:Uncharacterized protein n=1 Tax=Helicostylum pulchrum TaxID=562976 RepID=A0ABP9XXH5_9FUNG